MGKKQPKKVLKLVNKNKKQVPKTKELPTFTYLHSCSICGRFIKKTTSNHLQSETRGIDFCEKCGKNVETLIEWSELVSPQPTYSKKSPYTG